MIVLGCFVLGLIFGYGARRFARAERAYLRLPLGRAAYYQRVGVVSILQLGRFRRLRVGGSIVWDWDRTPPL